MYTWMVRLRPSPLQTPQFVVPIPPPLSTPQQPIALCIETTDLQFQATQVLISCMCDCSHILIMLRQGDAEEVYSRPEVMHHHPMNLSVRIASPHTSEPSEPVRVSIGIDLVLTVVVDVISCDLPSNQPPNSKQTGAKI